MPRIFNERLIERLRQLSSELHGANPLHYYDRLRELKRVCDSTQSLSHILSNLPQAEYNLEMGWREMHDVWPAGEAGYALRWDAIQQIVEQGQSALDTVAIELSTDDTVALQMLTEVFVEPVCNYMIDQLDIAGTTLYVLLRYKRWVEWFEADRLRSQCRGDDGRERVLDLDLRRFLFESGIDYPFSQPDSPRGRADIVARLETDDPLVLEVKVWDPELGYGEDRVRDGLRQVMDYADRYGKDKGYVVVFNLDRNPLIFRGDPDTAEWPS